MANAEPAGAGQGPKPSGPRPGAGGGPPRGPGGPFGGGGRKGWSAFFYWSAVLGVWGLIFLVAFLAVFARGLPDTSRLYEIQRQPSISYLDRNGALISMRGSQQAPPVDLSKLPPYVPAAFISIEDRRFYHHPGFDPIGMARMVVVNIREGRFAQGGSTITQQLARNLFLSPDQTVRRKLQELMLAVWLEWKFTKDQILALYLNRVNFGAGAYGIEAAAQRYFNKPAQDLSVGEAALLAGLLKAPSRYSPVSDEERAGRRATIVLDSMVSTGAITEKQREEAFAAGVRVTRTLAGQHAQYFVDWVDGQVRRLVGEQGLNQDLIVETTLDLSLNAAAENAVRTVLAANENAGAQQAAVVALDGVGRVRALLGGVDYSKSQYNRAIDARRQAGSSFKPFVYLAALEAGRSPDTPVVDEPVTIGNWTPQNYTQRYLGPITMQTAVAQSINTVAARMADEVGRDNVSRAAHRLGITSRIGLDPSMALGAVEVSPLEMAQAYAPFSNGGQLATAYGIERIRTRDGRVLYEHREERRTSVVANPPLSQMNQMLRTAMGSGTGTRARVAGYDLAGKTGTTSDYKDAWFVGYTGGFVAAVWVGKDDNTAMRRVTGGAIPADIWKGFMTAALPRLQVRAIPAGPPPQGGFLADPIGDILEGAREVIGGEAPQQNPTPVARPSPIEPTVPTPGAPVLNPEEAPLY
jgi:penicillin-binding protein 1A